MDKMLEKIGYDTQTVQMDKKANMWYWDEIDNICEKFTRELLSFSMPEIDINDDDILYLQNEIRDFAVELVEANSKARFPYVDENY